MSGPAPTDAAATGTAPTRAAANGPAPAGADTNAGPPVGPAANGPAANGPAPTGTDAGAGPPTGADANGPAPTKAAANGPAPVGADAGAEPPVGAAANSAAPIGAAAGDLAARQQALVASLVAGGDLPAGFDPAAVQATRVALRRKRAGEVAARWPMLAASYGKAWPATFATWAEGRPPNGSLRDGWDFARAMGPSLPELAREELAEREATFTYDGESAPVPRRPSLWSRLRRRH